MKRRLSRLGVLFVILFAILAIWDVRVQILQRQDISERPGNPRRAMSNENRGMLLDAAGLPVAQTKGGKRIYPAGSALAQLVGYSSPVYGESGLEAALDSILAPQGPPVTPLADVAGLFGRSQNTSAGSGGQAVLTLRRDISALVDAALPPTMHGAAVVLDPRNGAILAAVNRPTFDPNDLAAKWKDLRARTDAPLLDRALDGLYPPGSTFKMLTAGAALDSGTFVRTDTLADPGYFDIGGFRVHNAEHEATGTQTLVGAFALSSNVDFAQIGVRLGVDTFYDYLHRFHVGDDDGLLVSDSRDDVPLKSTITPSELAQMAFGQGGLAVTPLRMALIGATIANGGLLMRPQLVKQVRAPDRRAIDVPPVPWEQVISGATANDVRDMMEAVVRYGTGTAAQLPGVAVAGKTGTATHPGGPPDAWFVCFAPADRPRLVVAVVVEDAGYGGTYAAPIAKSILSGALATYTH